MVKCKDVFGKRWIYDAVWNLEKLVRLLVLLFFPESVPLSAVRWEVWFLVS
mgnify:CR=1 FL=1